MFNNMPLLLLSACATILKVSVKENIIKYKHVGYTDAITNENIYIVSKKYRKIK